jgi:hypothetical protein
MTGRSARMPSMLALLVVATGLPACETCEPLTIALEASADTVVRTDVDTRRNDNYGCGPFLHVGTGRGGNLQPEGAADAIRSLVRFDLGGIDPRTVYGATLELTLAGYTSGSASTIYTVDAHRVLRTRGLTPWVEGDGYEGPSAIPLGCRTPDEAAGVAWFGAPDLLDRRGVADSRNNQTQPGFDDGIVDRIIIEQGLDTRGDVFELDVSELVDDWLWGKRPNEGLLLRDSTTDGEFHHVDFGSREGEDAGGVTGPRLVLWLRP